MKKKSILLNLSLLFLSLFICFVVAEIGWRFIIFSDSEIFKNQQQAFLYADPYSEDDYWKLQFNLVTKKDTSPTIIKHRTTLCKQNKIYYTRYILLDNYKHVNFTNVNNKRPVLLYGDSFAACYSKNDCFEHILNNDEAFSKKNYLLNYGVGEYGLDQIYLLFKNSVDNYKKPFVVISLMTLDLDRSILSVRGGPKPFFSIENNMLKLHEQPAYSNLESFFSNNKPQIISYFYRRGLYSKAAKKLMPDKLISYLKKEEYYKTKKIQINKKIITEIVEKLKARKIDYVFLVFHPNFIPECGKMNQNVTDWRSTFIRNLLDENSIPYIWSKDIILQNMKDENLSLSEYYDKDGHPNAYQRKLLSQRIKEIVLQGSQRK